MRKRTIPLLGVLLLLAINALAARPHYDRLFRPAKTADYHVPVGLCEDYPEETTTLEGIRKDMAFLKKSHIDLLRISFGWDAIESVKDQYNWLFWDDFVRIAVEEYGITLIPYVCYMPRWNSTKPEDNNWFWNYPPVDPGQFGEFMKALVTRYKKYIKTWELWNEPDIWVYWQGTPEQFAEMIRIGARAVKEADPKAKVVLGGIAYREEFLTKMFRDYGLSPWIDVVNMHNYLETWSPRPVEEIDDHIAAMSDVIRQYGRNQSLWMAEVGYSTFRQGSKISNDYTAYYEYEHTPAYQAVDLFKRLALIVLTEKISAVAWYEISDLPPSDEVIGDEYNNRHLGVAFVNYLAKPAQQALVFFNTLFSQKYRNITPQVTVSRLDPSDSHTLAFRRQDGSVILVSWLQTCLPAHRTADSTGAVRDDRHETLSVALPLALKGQAHLYDHLGNEKPLASLRREKGRTLVENIELTGGMVSIIRIEK